MTADPDDDPEAGWRALLRTQPDDAELPEPPDDVDLAGQQDEVPRGTPAPGIVTLDWAALGDLPPEPEPGMARGIPAAPAVVAVIASPKVGKSTLLGQAALSVAGDRDDVEFLGEPVNRRGPALLVMEEGSLAGMAWRLRHQAAALGIVAPAIEVAHRQRIRLDDARRFAPLRDHALSLRPVLIVLDPLNRLHGQDENSSTAMTPVMDRLADLADELTAVVAVVHHLGKPSQERRGSIWDRIRGASAIRSATDANLAMEANSAGTSVRLSGEFRDSEPLDTWIDFDREQLLFLPGDAPTGPAKVPVDQLMELVDGKERVTARDVMERFSVSKHTALAALEASDLDRASGPRGVLMYFRRTV